VQSQAEHVLRGLDIAGPDVVGREIAAGVSGVYVLAHLLQDDQGGQLGSYRERTRLFHQLPEVVNHLGLTQTGQDGHQRLPLGLGRAFHPLDQRVQQRAMAHLGHQRLQASLQPVVVQLAARVAVEERVEARAGQHAPINLGRFALFRFLTHCESLSSFLSLRLRSIC